MEKGTENWLLLVAYLHSYRYSLIVDINTSDTGMLRVPLNVGKSAAYCQGNVREFCSVWRVVTLLIIIIIIIITAFQFGLNTRELCFRAPHRLNDIFTFCSCNGQ